MDSRPRETPSGNGAAFVKGAREQRPGFFAELIYFLRTNKKWWLTPIVLVLLIMGALIFLSGTAVAPFIYTLF